MATKAPDGYIKMWKVYRKVQTWAGEWKYADTDGLVYLTYQDALRVAKERTELIGEKHVAKHGFLKPQTITIG